MVFSLRIGADVAAGVLGSRKGANVQHTKPHEETKLATELFLTVNSRVLAYVRRNSRSNVHVSRICRIR